MDSCPFGLRFGSRALQSFEKPLFHKIAELFNNSTTAQYLISCKKEALIITECGFDVKLIAQLPTSMHSSGEGHQLYIYKRLGKKVGPGGEREVGGVKCDPLFAKRFEQVCSGPKAVLEQVLEDIKEFCAFNPVKQRVKQRKSPDMYEPEDWRANKTKKSVEKSRLTKQPKPRSEAARKETRPDSNVSKRMKESLKKRKPVDQQQPNPLDTKRIVRETKHSKHCAGTRADNNSVPTGEWECPRCHLYNPLSKKSCGVCPFRVASWSCQVGGCNRGVHRVG